MSQATARLENKGRVCLVLAINGHYYGDYPIDNDSAEGQIRMMLEDAKDYGCDKIELIT